MAACSVRLQQAVLALQGALASWRAQKAGGAFPLKVFSSAGSSACSLMSSSVAPGPSTDTQSRLHNCRAGVVHTALEPLV
ncbi:conserved hypothetical protein [Coccidioides posadasii str. Silveira]|uniref:Uncharacterized protein n=1 Tax=Coccidioides posadasii (strain RMSCC 757 / Silveira) TaxID=443226 RepID=E9DHY1_COCPS|nr:conserved hypothetical protein [Coccidioides posadasii str. Silveira]